jgi:hypothetical protein
MQGNTILNSNFVSFTYTSNLLSLSFSGAPTEPALPGPGKIFSITGILQNLPGPAFVEIDLGPSVICGLLHELCSGHGSWTGSAAAGCD